MKTITKKNSSKDTPPVQQGGTKHKTSANERNRNAYKKKKNINK